MKAIFLLLALSFAGVAAGQWNRYVETGNGSRTELAEAHPMVYFTRDGLLREDGRVQCSYCTEAEKAKILATGRAEVYKVGKVAGYMVYDVSYYFEPTRQLANAKAILVETEPGQLREIFYLENMSWDLGTPATQIAGRESPNQMLWMETFLGNRGMTMDYEFWLAPGMSLQLDLRVVKAAAAKGSRLAPFNRNIEHFAPPEFGTKGRGLVMRWATADAVGKPLGSIDVTFRIDHGKAIVTKTNYSPDPHP